MARKLLVLAAAFVLGLAAVEAAARLALRGEPAERARLARFRAYVADPTQRLYDPHPFTGYDLRRASPERHMGARVPLERSPGVPRIACLGGSTTQGGRDSWPGALRRLLERDTGERVEVMNWGVVGWTTAETLVAWALRGQAWSPDIVLVHHAANDVRPRLQPGFRADYSHYSHPWIEPSFGPLERAAIRWSDWYARRRVDVFAVGNVMGRVTFEGDDPRRTARAAREGLAPETAAAFERNVTSLCRLVQAGGARCALLTMPQCSLAGARRVAASPAVAAALRGGIREHNAILRRVAEREGALLVDLERWFADHEAQSEPWFRDVVHVDKDGDRQKADLVAEALLGAGWLAASPGAAPR